MPNTGYPFIKPQFFTNAGEPASLYKLYTYDAGTLTKRNTYTTSALTSANANPIVLDAAGRASIFLLPQFYRFILATPSAADPPLLATQIWDSDDNPAFGSGENTYDTQGTAGEAIAANEACYLSDGSGALTGGRWYKTDADNTYSSIGAVTIGFAIAAITSGTSGTFRRRGRMPGFSGLTPGAVYYVSATAGAITSTPPTSVIAIGKAESATTLVLDIAHGDAGTGVSGLISTAAQVWPGTYTFTIQPLEFTGGLTATIAGVYAKDVTVHAVPNSSTNLVMTDSEIPANFLNVDGRQIEIRFGTSSAVVDAGLLDIKLDIGGTVTTLFSFVGGVVTGWSAKVTLTRISSTQVEISGFCQGTSASALAIPATVVGSLTFSGSIDLRTLCTTNGAITDQTYYIAKVIG